jgi:hypothetical protein
LRDVANIIKALKKLGPLSLVVLDTLAQVTAGGDENSGADMGRALQACKAIHKATGAMVEIVTHTGKDASRGIRGWSGVMAAMDSAMCVEVSGDYRSATITKLKDGRGHGTQYPFSLVSVGLGVDEDGDAISSCVVKEGVRKVQGQDRVAQPTTPHQILAHGVARELTDLAEGVTYSELLTSVAGKMAVSPSAKADNRGRDAKRAIEWLIANGRVVVTDGVIGVT